MNIPIRFIRRPVNTLLWLSVLTAMSLLVYLGANLLHSALQARDTIDASHITVANVKPSNFGDSIQFLTEEELHQLEQLDYVQSIDLRRFSMGYSPQLQSTLALHHWAADDYLDPYAQCNQSYDDVLMAGTVTDLYLSTGESGVEVYLYLDVDEILAMHPGYPVRPEQVRFHCFFPDEIPQDFFDSFYAPGQRYLFLGRYDHTRSFFLCDGNRKAPPCQSVSSGGYVQFTDETCTELRMYEFDRDMEWPSIVKLDGSAQSFLERNAFWQETRTLLDIRQHVFPVLGTGNAQSFYAFVSDRGRLMQGRFFTQEEYDAGSKVCMISQLAATASGLSVGDTISLRQYCYRNDSIFSLILTPEDLLGHLPLEPFEHDTPFQTQEESFTIVGLYSLDDPWEDSAYAFTANTILIPSGASAPDALGQRGTSYSLPVETADGSADSIPFGGDRLYRGVLLSLILENGSRQALLDALAGTGIAEKLVITDTGFETIMDSIPAVVAAAQKLLLLCLTCWLLLLLLYILLYQGKERQTLGIMRSLGAQTRQTRRYLFGSGLLLAVAGILLGAIVSSFVGELVQEKLLAALLDRRVTQAVLPSLRGGKLPLPAQALLAAGQAAIMGLLLWLHAFWLSRQNPRKLLH